MVFGRSSGLLLGALFFYLLPDLASSELLRYTDSDGRIHYVDRIEGVPAEYRATAQPSASRVSRVPAREYSAEALRPAGVPGVEVFVADWCPHCRALEAFLRKNDIPYQRHDIEKSARARSRYLELGGGGIPIVKIGSQVSHGFDEHEIRERLGIR